MGFSRHQRGTRAAGQGSEDSSTIGVQKDVLWLEIAINDIKRVKMGESHYDFGYVDGDPPLREPALPLEVIEELTPVHKIEDHVELALRLEGPVEGDDEGMLNLP